MKNILDSTNSVSNTTLLNWNKLNIENQDLIHKLKNRANKSLSTKKIVPTEYLNSKNQDDFNIILNYFLENNISLYSSIFLILIKIIKENNLFEKIIFDKSFIFNSRNKQIQEELLNFQKKYDTQITKKDFDFIIDKNININTDIVGGFYQALKSEGEKSKTGSYYTPENIVSNITNEYIKKNMKVLDPCCGTGQFLLSFSNTIKNPKNIFGYDIDDIAVKIARINLLIKYKNIDFNPNIFTKNFLLESENLFFNNQIEKDFDIIATNPPFGVHFTKDEEKYLKLLYKNINSLESFSYFIQKSLDLLKEDSILSFILPESILKVSVHKDIRKFILENTKILKINYLDRVFTGVFSPIIRLDLCKTKNIKNNKIEINKKEKYFVEQDNFYKNQDYIFDIDTNDFDNKIIHKVFSYKHTTLKNNSDFVLGIVTGNNEKLIKKTKEKDLENIYKGSDVDKFILKECKNFIKWSPENFQQSQDISKYKSKEKFIYKFISNKIVVAMDCKGSLTLNSANIFLPKIKDIDNKIILALFNSTLYNFIFQKKFNSIKILKNHLEYLPVPFFEKKYKNVIIKSVNNILDTKNTKEELNEKIEKLDNFIFTLFNFSEKEIAYIKKNTR